MSNSSREILRRFFVIGYDELRARLTRRLGSVELASDALHETWLRIESATPAGTVLSPKHYLLQMASNVALKRLSAENRFVTLNDAKMAVGLIDDAPDPERAAVARSEVEALARALAELTPRRRDILLASRLNTIPLWAIAERLGVSQRLVEIELKHALAHCELRLQRNVIKRFGPKPSEGSQAKQGLNLMPGIWKPNLADSEHIMVTDIPEHPAGFLKAPDREAHDWMTRFAAGNAGPADLAAFKKWSARDPAHTEAFVRACRLWEAVGPASDLLAVQQAAHVPMRNKRIGRRVFLGGALAASAAGAAYLVAQPPLGLWPSLSELAADYRTAPGEQRSIAFAEGPSVELNTRTSIALKTSADGVERIELLGGEAAIATRPEVRRIVQVIAADGQVAAADAVFNIRYERNIVCATCVGGAVDVTRGDRSARLHPGEQIIYSPNGLESVTKVDAAVVTAWKNGMLVFQSTPLADAVVEINRYRSGHIIVTNPALGRRLFNARFQIANIGGVVAQIQQVFGASVTSLPGGVVLLG